MDTNNQKCDQNTIPNDADKQQKGVNVPNLRFPNFNSIWQKNKFGNLLTLLKNNTLSRAELNYENGKIKNIHYGDVLIKFNDFVLSDSKIIPYINDDSIPHNYADLLLKTGDLIIADTAEDYTVGKATELIFNDQSLIISGLHTIPCRPINDIFGSKYLGYYINSPSFHNQLLPLIQGIKVSSISKSQIVDTFISYPKINEQCKITEFLTLLDQRIDTQSKIIEKYESLIKAISNKLFFNITNRVNLSEICSITTGKLDANQMDENGIYPFFTCGKETLKINKYAFDCEAILISGNGDIGRTKYYNGKFNAYQRTYILYNFKGSPIFIKYAIDYALPKKVKEETQISAMPYIKLGTLSELRIPYPDIHIQIEDVQILNTLQTKINVEKDILEKLKEQKKYLLSNMFI